MPNLTQPDDNPPDPHATPYFRRRAAVLEAVAEARLWYRALPPGPLAA